MEHILPHTMTNPVGPPKTQGRHLSIDVLRGVAALGVVVAHIWLKVPNGGLRMLASTAAHFLGLGLSLFIVISGFCIHLRVARRMAAGQGVRSDWRSFWRRRFWRLYPPYLAAGVLGIITYRLSAPSVMQPFEVVAKLPWDIATHLVMIHNLFVDYSMGLGNGPLWSLGMEEQLYALYAVFLVIRARRSASTALLIGFVVTAAWLACLTRFPERVGSPPLSLGHWTHYPLAYWFQWLLGAVAAEAYVGVVRLPDWMNRGRTLALAALFCVASSPMTLGVVVNSNFGRGIITDGLLRNALSGVTNVLFIPISGVLSFLIINALIRAESRGRLTSRAMRALAGVGQISYSLYLTHIPVLHLAETYLPLGTGWGSMLLRYATQIPLCVAVGAVNYYLVERRFIARSRTKKWRSIRQEVADNGIAGRFSGSRTAGFNPLP